MEKQYHYDSELGVEIYRLRGHIPAFRRHFHEHYSIGLIIAGSRLMTCRGREYLAVPGSVILLAPGDSHDCREAPGSSRLIFFAASTSVPRLQAICPPSSGRTFCRTKTSDGICRHF